MPFIIMDGNAPFFIVILDVEWFGSIPASLHFSGHSLILADFTI